MEELAGALFEGVGSLIGGAIEGAGSLIEGAGSLVDGAATAVTSLVRGSGSAVTEAVVDVGIEAADAALDNKKGNHSMSKSTDKKKRDDRKPAPWDGDFDGDD